MIKREYFISTICYYGDGSMSHSFTYAQGDYTSFLPDTKKVYKAMTDSARQTYTDKGLDAENMHVLAFNRI
jgi:hypothetical protein